MRLLSHMNAYYKSAMKYFVYKHIARYVHIGRTNCMNFIILSNDMH